MTDPTTHLLKCKEPFYSLVDIGAKRFEIRQYSAQWCGRGTPPANPEFCPDCKGRRNFVVGDFLELHQIDHDGKNTGRHSRFRIEYILWDHDYPAIQSGFCIISFSDKIE